MTSPLLRTPTTLISILLVVDMNLGAVSSMIKGTSRIHNRYRASARGSGGSRYCDRLSGLADQHAVGNRSGAGTDAEQGIKRGMPCAAPIEAEDELVEIVLEVGFPQPVIDAQAPALEV